MSYAELLAKGTLKAWASLGVEIVKWTDDALYITVPRESDQLDAHGVPMAGRHLATQIQRNLDMLTHGRKYTVKFKIV